MKKIIANALVAILSAPLGGCAVLERATFYSAVPGDVVSSEQWGDGTAFAVDRVCLWIGEGPSKDYRVLAMGPIIPVIPIQAIGKDKERPEFLDLIVWIIPDKKQTGFYFDPKDVVVEFADGTRKVARTVQVSRFKTSVTTVPGFFYGTKTKERISFPEHWEAKSIEDFQEPVALFDWSRFVLHYEVPSKSTPATAVIITGLAQGSKQQLIPRLNLVGKKDTRYLRAGETGDNTPIGETVAPTCRRLLGRRASS